MSKPTKANLEPFDVMTDEMIDTTDVHPWRIDDFPLSPQPFHLSMGFCGRTQPFTIRGRVYPCTLIPIPGKKHGSMINLTAVLGTAYTL